MALTWNTAQRPRAGAVELIPLRETCGQTRGDDGGYMVTTKEFWQFYINCIKKSDFLNQLFPQPKYTMNIVGIINQENWFSNWSELRLIYGSKTGKSS